MFPPELKDFSREVGGPLFGLRETTAEERAPLLAVLERFEKLYYPGVQERVIPLGELAFYFIDPLPSAFPIHIAVPERLVPTLCFATGFGKALFGWPQKPPEVGHPFTLIEWANRSAAGSQGNLHFDEVAPLVVKPTHSASFEPSGYGLGFLGVFNADGRVKETGCLGAHIENALVFIGFRGLYPSLHQVGPNHALDGFVFI